MGGNGERQESLDGSEKRVGPWFSRNWLNVVGLLVGVPLAIWGLYAQYAASLHREFSFSLPQLPTRVVDRGAVSPSVKVLDAAGKVVEMDVYLVEVIVWNSGSMPIEPKDVRKSLQIQIGGERILSAEIVQANYPDISGWIVTTKAGKDSQPSVGLDWKYLDPGFAARIRVLCTATSVPRVSLIGYIANGRKIKNISPPEKLSYVGLISTGFMLIAVVTMLLRERKRQGRLTTPQVDIPILVFTILIFLLNAYAIAARPNIPFSN